MKSRNSRDDPLELPPLDRRRPRGPYGYYAVRSNGVDPKQGFITEGNIHTNVIGLFVQDAWTINNKLTINAGIRTERERVPTYTTGHATSPSSASSSASPTSWRRALGFAYDIKGDGRWKAFGSWGMFYDIFKLELPRGSFGGDKWLDYYYTLDTLDWTTLVDGPNCPPACPGTLIRGTDRLPAPVVRVRRDRSRSQADAAAGSDRRHRAPAERRDRR